MQEKSQELVVNDKWCKEKWKRTIKPLINKHRKVVCVGRTWITLCEKETPQLPAITNTHPTFLAFHMCLEFIYIVQWFQWKYTEQSDATTHTHITWVQKLVTMSTQNAASHTTQNLTFWHWAVMASSTVEHSRTLVFSSTTVRTSKPTQYGTYR